MDQFFTLKYIKLSIFFCKKHIEIGFVDYVTKSDEETGNVRSCVQSEHPNSFFFEVIHINIMEAPICSLEDHVCRNLESEVEIPRIGIGKKQTIETLINEEALLLAKFLRDERKTWTPRIPVL